MRGMLRNFGAIGAGSSRASGNAHSGIDEGQRLAMLDAFEEDEIGWFWATDSENRLIYLSASAARRFAPDRPLIGQPLTAVVETASGEGEERTERPLSFLLGARNRFNDFTVRVETVDGEMFWSLTGKPSFDANERFEG